MTLKLSNRARNALCDALFGGDRKREITTEDLASINCQQLIRMKGVGRLSFANILDALQTAGGRLECGCPSAGLESMTEEQRIDHNREARDRYNQRRLIAERVADVERVASFRRWAENAERTKTPLVDFTSTDRGPNS